MKATESDNLLRCDGNTETIVFTGSHWFSGKAMTITGFGKRPKGVRQWARCLWNADIFFGPVPFLKSIAAVSWILAVLI